MKSKKTSIVFGGTKGIGLEIYKKLRNRGDDVFAVSRKKVKNVRSIELDLLDDIKLDKFLKKKFSKKIDNLIFSQRYRGDNHFDEYKLMIISVVKIINCLKHKMSKNASIVILSSVSVVGVVLDQDIYYHVIRGGINSMAKYFAVKLGKFKIRVNTISPSRVIKKENEKFYKKNKMILNNLIKINPLGRSIHAYDISEIVSFLTSPESSSLTGQDFKVDGGVTLINQEHILYLKNDKN